MFLKYDFFINGIFFVEKKVKYLMSIEFLSLSCPPPNFKPLK